METLYKKITEIKPEQWDYNFENHPDLLTIQQIFENNDYEKFIRDYFHRAGKDNIFTDYFEFKDNDDLITKSQHTVSIFFLGILIYNSIKKLEVPPLNRIQSRYEFFPFIWFLTCLFHDYGYEYEKNSKKNLEKIWDINSLKIIFKIKYDLLKEEVKYVPTDIFQSINKYFLYKRFIRKEIDHGIVAGIYYYDQLVKNRIKQHKKSNNKQFWKKDLEKQYALAGATIAIHNIWFPKKKDEKKYNLFELDKLKRKPITLKEAPLLFLLGLVDTIDPVKLFCENGENIKDVLNGILIDFDTDEIKIGISGKPKLCLPKLFNKCKGLTKWLDVKIECKNKLISIKLKS